MGMEEPVSHEVNATRRHREHLIVCFYLQFQMFPEILPDIDKEGMQGGFIGAQDDQVIAVPEVISDPLLLL